MGAGHEASYVPVAHCPDLRTDNERGQPSPQDPDSTLSLDFLIA